MRANVIVQDDNAAANILASNVFGMPTATQLDVSKRNLYGVYSFSVTALLLSLVTSALLDTVFDVENQNDFSDNIYLTTAVIISNYKMFNFHARQDAIMDLINNMHKKPFSAEDEAEENILTKYQKMIR